MRQKIVEIIWNQSGCAYDKADRILALVGEGDPFEYHESEVWAHATSEGEVVYGKGATKQEAIQNLADTVADCVSFAHDDPMPDWHRVNTKQTPEPAGGETWIACSERMPADHCIALCHWPAVNAGPCITTAFFDNDDKSFRGSYHGPATVTHWQPLPKPPSGARA